MSKSLELVGRPFSIVLPYFFLTLDLIKKILIYTKSSDIFFKKVSWKLIKKSNKQFSNAFILMCVNLNFKSNFEILIQNCYLLGLAEWYIPQGGMFFWIKVTVVNDIMDLVMNKCIPQGILVLPGNAFNYDPSKQDCHLRLSYSYASLEEMDKVILNIITFNCLCHIL